MDLHADFTRRAAVHAAALPWRPSPMAGVDRRMLDRVGDEVARATSIVRYAPDSKFSSHTHGGGEEFLVLEGIFSDEHGDYPVGTYVRNPPHSAHTPGSKPGCTIFVKLWQFDPSDQMPVRTETDAANFTSIPNRPGVAALDLFAAPAERVWMETWAVATPIEIPAAHGLELLVLDGDFTESGERFAPMSWLRLPPGATFKAEAGPAGCKVWLKSDHLDPPRGSPGRESA